MGTGKPSFLPKMLHHLGKLFLFFAFERACSYHMLLGKRKENKQTKKTKHSNNNIKNKTKNTTLIKTLLLAMLFNPHSSSAAVLHLRQIVPAYPWAPPHTLLKKIKSNHSLNTFIKRDKRVSVPLSTSGEHKSNNITVK